jgi:TRAP-type mannitol/chloroaromatic compound transport system permease large subunit
MMALLPFVVMVLTLLLGLPIAFALAVAGIVGIYLHVGDWNVVLRILGTTPFSTVADYVLTTIPMFILMAYFSASGGLARDLYTAGAHWLSRVKGGLAIATVFACGIFGAMSGASLLG